MSIYIHIGYPKAASSWLQGNFLPFVENIKIHDRKLIQKCFIEPDAFSFDADTARNSFVIDTEKDNWFSEERLLGGLRLGGVRGYITKEVVLRLKSVFPDAKIILFIRNQIDILASSYLQYVKSGGNLSVNSFLFPEKRFGLDLNKMIVLGLDFFIYDRVIEFYIKLFGKENVFVFLYETFAENPQLFISSFANQFNLKYNKDFIDFSPKNKGYRSILLFTRRISNILGYNGPLNKYYLIHIPKFIFISKHLHNIANRYRIFGKRPDSNKLLGKKNVEYLLNYYAPSNRRLKDVFDIKNLDKYNYPI